MDLFSKFTIAHFIWYLVPGLAFVFLLFFPLIVLDPHLAKLLFNGLGPIGVILFSILAGFVLDGLRLYRFRTNYDSIKSDFFNNLKNEVGVNIDPYVIQSHVSEVARIKKNTGIGIHHAIWIMHGHLSSIALLESLFWIVTALYFQLFGKPICPLLIFSVKKTLAISFYFGFALLFILVGYRIEKISIEDQKTTNSMFLYFAKHNKNDVLQLMANNIPPNQVP